MVAVVVTDDDMEILSRIDGLFYGMLTPDEQIAFDRLRNAGLVVKSYDGAAGFLGLAHVRRVAT